MLDDPTPLSTSGGGCGAAARGTAGRWCRCDGTPEYAGEWTFIGLVNRAENARRRQLELAGRPADLDAAADSGSR